MYDPFFRLVGRSKPMMELKKSIEQIAATDVPVLLTGETGVGKEVVARVIHDLSPRARKPYIPLNMASLPESLVESELFGYKKGAFTGALQNRKGRFEEADGGTLFMDEIGEMPLALQSKLLRVLEDMTVIRVGEDISKGRKVDVRVITATNRDLKTMAQNGEFRKDLYYRLNGVPLHIPALRERREDIPLLIDHFLRLLKQEKGLLPFRLTEQALTSLQYAPWEGNVRELFQLVQRLAIYYPGKEIQYDDLPIEYRIELSSEQKLLLLEDHTPICLYGEDLTDRQRVTDASVAISVPRSEVAPADAPAPAAPSTETGTASASGGRQQEMVAGDPEAIAASISLDAREGMDLSSFLKQVEYNLIVQALKATRGNNSQAARLLNMNRTTLVEKIKRYGIRSEEFAE